MTSHIISLCLALLSVGLNLNPVPAFSPARTVGVSPRKRSSVAHQTRSSSYLISTSLHVKKGFSLLEISGLIPQGPLVSTAKEGWRMAWATLMTELAPQDQTGAYVRPSYTSSDKTNKVNLKASERYHLYVGNPCPWCHRCVLAVNLLNLPITTTRLQDDPTKASRGGWVFAPRRPDPVFGAADLREVYDALTPGGYRGRCTAPLLVDKRNRQFVSNESSNIVRLLQDMARNTSSSSLDLVPADLAETIDTTNEWVYRLLNNGVYRCGFSTTQNAYDKARADVHEGLQRADSTLREQPYLNGEAFTESDLYLLPTMLRFDGVYGPLFRASRLRVRDYPHLLTWLRRCWAMDGVKESIDLADATGSYFRQLFPLNPSGIVPEAITEEEMGLVND